jgi:hypothetical protein
MGYVNIHGRPFAAAAVNRRSIAFIWPYSSE